MKRRWIWAVAAGAALGMAAFAQTQEPTAIIIQKEIRTAPGPLPADVMYEAAPALTMGFVGAEMSFSDKPVKGAPYAADATTETTQTLSDGNRITRKTTSSLYRDNEGRTRREENMAAIGAWTGSETHQMIFINDPVAGVSYHLDPQAHVAHTLMNRKGVFTAMAAPGGGQQVFAFRHDGGPPGVAGAKVVASMAGGSDTASAAKAVKTESLGKQTFEGVEADGTRTTVTIPANTIGNERPIETVSERWYSQELQTIVMSKRSDPRFGETVYRLTNVRRGDQPSNLFEVPSDYTVEKDDMKIQLRHDPSDK